MRNKITKKLRVGRALIGLALLAFPTFAASQVWSLDVLESENPVRSAVAVESSASVESEAILQTAAQTPISTDSDSGLGTATRKTGAPSRGGAMAAELENLPNLNVRPDDPTQVEHKPHGAALFDVTPGVTLFSDLKKNPILANPVAEETVDGGYTVATFQVATLPDTTIQIVGFENLVEAIMINLDEPRLESDARKVFEAEIDGVRPILIPDELGNFREVFPEKGVAFVLEKSETPGVPSPRVVQIAAETVKSEYFILRAEQELQTSLTKARDDAEHALLHDPDAAGAHWILAQTHLAVGDYSEARKHIFKAIKLNDSFAQFHLTLIDALIRSEEIDAAARYMDAVKDVFVEHPLYQIEAVCFEAELKREAVEPDYDAAISLGQRAIKMVKTLVEANPTADVSLSARKLELRATLDVAIAVARKSWKEETDREKAFEWLVAADEIAKEIDKSRGKSELPSARFDVLETTFVVGLEMPDSEKIDVYATDLRGIADKYLASAVDEVSAASARWKAGNALNLATKIYEARKDYKQTVVYGLKALEYLETVLKYRPESDRSILGILQIRLGVDFLNGLKNEKEAFAYFEKASELFKTLEKELNPRAAAEVGTRLAEMGAIYWKSGQKNEAVDLLKRSVALLERAVEAGDAPKTALYVPYANLSTMCKGLKMTADAAKYAKLAASVAPSK